MAKPGDLRARRALVTLAAIALWLAMNCIPAPGSEVAEASLQGFRSFFRAGGGVSIAALGVAPFTGASLLVELAAALWPTWRGLRHGAGRARLWRATVVLGAILALFQARQIEVAMIQLESWSGASPHDPVMLLATLVAGGAVALLLARWIDDRGLGSGFLVLWSSLFVVRLLDYVIAPDSDDRLVQLVLSLAFPALVVACVVTATLPPARPASKEGGKLWLPWPVAGAVPAIVTSAAFAYMGPYRAKMGGPVGWLLSLLSLSDNRLEWKWLALELGCGALLSIAMAWLLAGPRRVGEAWRHAAPEVEHAFWDAAGVSVGFTSALLLVEQLVGGGTRPTLLAAYAVFGALCADVMTEIRARASEQECVLGEERPYAAVRAVELLRSQGIAAWCRNLRLRALLQFLGPYVPIEVMVARADAAKARELLKTELDPEAESATALPLLGERRVWGLGGATAVALLSAGLWYGAEKIKPAPEAAGPAAKLELIALDDDIDPFERRLNDKEVPPAVRFEAENVPLGKDAQSHSTTAPRYYARITGQVIGDEARAWLAKVWLPAGRRFAFGKLYEYDESDQAAWIGWRTYVLSGQPQVESRHLRDVHAMTERASDSKLKQWYLMVTLTEEGARRFEAATRALVKRRFAIVVDGEVMSAPVVQEPIAGGTMRITMGAGDSEKQKHDAEALAAALRRSIPR